MSVETACFDTSTHDHLIAVLRRLSQAPHHSPRCAIMTTPDPEGSRFSAESYFGTQPPPPTLDLDIAGVRSFVHRQRDLGRNVALVTVSAALFRPLSTDSYVSLSRVAGQLSRWSSTCEHSRFAPVNPAFTKAHSSSYAMSRVRFLDNFSAGGSLARASIVSSRFLNGL